MRSILGAVYRVAMENDKVKSNPARAIRSPQRGQHENQIIIGCRRNGDPCGDFEILPVPPGVADSSQYRHAAE